MKRTSLWKRGIGLLLVSALLAAAAAALAGCGTDIIPSGTAQLGNLTEGLTPNKVTVNVDMDEQSVLITDFALRLLRASRHEGESTLVSPLSVLYALAMTANGAEGETKGQIESALGLRIEELNEYLYGYNVMLPQGWNSKIGIANSIWLNEAKQTSVKTDFLQANVDYLRADVYRVPFDDKTCADINGWVKEATDGLMPNMLDEVSSEAIVYLINALVFESPWFEPYKPEQVEPGVFTTEDDVKRKASFMYSTEEEYFSDGVTVGFAKTFDRDYAFVALLPDEHLRMDEFLDSLTGESLQDLLATSRRVKVTPHCPNSARRAAQISSRRSVTWGYPGFLTRRKPSLAASARAGCISTGCCTKPILPLTNTAAERVRRRRYRRFWASARTANPRRSILTGRSCI